MTSWRQLLREREGLEAQLHLLDRQVVDSEGRMAGKVDDLELTEAEDGRLMVTAILTGPGALGPRIGGVLGALATATWSRLSGHPKERPGRIDHRLITEIGTVIRLASPHTALETQGFETWVRTRIIEALPYAGAAARQDLQGTDEGGEDGAEEAPPLDRLGARAAERSADRRRMSELVGMPVMGGGARDERERVIDVLLRCDATDRLLVDGLVLGRRRPGTLFGFHRRSRQGPWIVRIVVLALHRHVRDVPWADVAPIGWADHTIRLRREG